MNEQPERDNEAKGGRLLPAAHGSASGPRYCAICGQWPAIETTLGLRFWDALGKKD